MRRPEDAPISTWKKDDNGNPTGGHTEGIGFTIEWQDGVKNYSGATIEDLTLAIIARLEHFQDSRFSCRENALAITKFQEGVHWLDHRKTDRMRRGVEGTYQT
jgi:hypothetical protein